MTAFGCARLAAAVLALAPLAPARAAPAALELLLAVDASISVTESEFELQVGGLAQALRSDAVIEAIRAAGPDGIAVAVFQWGHVHEQQLTVSWMRVAGRRDAQALSARIAAMPRLFVGGATAIRAAIDFASGQFAGNGFEAPRRVIDISADGENNSGDAPARARDRAVAGGIVINGLTILNEAPLLDRYFAENVIGGPGAFVETAGGHINFAAAIERKLVREIGGRPAS